MLRKLPPSDDAPQEDDLTLPEPAPSAAEIHVQAANPFGDGFEEEESVRDHYASLEAKSGLLGARPLSPQEHEFAAAVQTIFQPPAEDRGVARATAPDAAGIPAAASIPATAAASQDRPAATPAEGEEEAAAVTAVEHEDLSEDTLESDEPDTLRVAALRDLPPDDSDLIVVMDAEAHIAPLSRVPGKAHRQEYRHLFTKLREG